MLTRTEYYKRIKEAISYADAIFLYEEAVGNYPDIKPYIIHEVATKTLIF